MVLKKKKERENKLRNKKNKEMKTKTQFLDFHPKQPLAPEKKN